MICVSVNGDFFMGTYWLEDARKLYFRGLYVGGGGGYESASHTAMTT